MRVRFRCVTVVFYLFSPPPCGKVFFRLNGFSFRLIWFFSAEWGPGFFSAEWVSFSAEMVFPAVSGAGFFG